MLVRLGALGPLLMLAVPRALRPLVWLLIAATAWTAGAAAAGRLATRPAAVATDPHGPSAYVQHEGQAVLRVTARPRPTGGHGWSAPARLLSWQPVATDPSGPRTGDGVMIRLRGEPPNLGDVLGGRWRLAPPRRAAVPGGFDEGAWLLGRSLLWSAASSDSLNLITGDQAGLLGRLGRCQGCIQTELRRRLAAGLTPPEAALAQAILLGGGSQRDLREPFSRLGLAHLFALSGLHVGIVGGLLLLGLRLVVRGPTRQLLAMAVALALYAVLVDGPDSVVRAVGLVLLTMALKAAGRPADGLRILGLLLWLNALWRPEGLFDVGLRLSYSAAGGIVCAQRLLGADLRRCPRWLRWPLQGLTVSLSAQSATLPVVADAFGFLPLAAPLSNLIAVPVFGLAATCLGGGLLLTCVSSWAGQGLLACGWMLLRPLRAATCQAAPPLAPLEMGLLPWGCGRVLLYAVCLAAIVLVLARARGRRRLWAIPLQATLLLVASGSAPAGERVEAWQFAVDQGDCALVRLPDGWTCLIDTGPGRPDGGGPCARDVLPFLRRLGLRRLDAVILTHDHADHTGGVVPLSRALAVGHWYLGGAASAPQSAQAWTRPSANDTLHQAGAWALVCVHPPDSNYAMRNENDHSLAVALCREGRLHGLWTGDLEGGGERAALLNLPLPGREGVDFWKAGHHGSSTSGTRELLARIEPRLVVISCGVANRHRHPSHGPYGRARCVRTDLQATVQLNWDRQGRLRWRALQRPPVAEPPP